MKTNKNQKSNISKEKNKQNKYRKKRNYNESIQKIYELLEINCPQTKKVENLKKEKNPEKESISLIKNQNNNNNDSAFDVELFKRNNYIINNGLDYQLIFTLLLTFWAHLT